MTVTNTKRWQENARSEPRITWLHRSEIVAHLIRPSDVVCDLAAGAQTLRRFLPKSVGYLPVDCVKEHPDTWVADFNGEFELPDKPFNVITCIGLLAHLADPGAFLERLASAHAGKFIVLAAGHFSDKWLSQYIADLTLVATLGQHRIYTGVLRPSGSLGGTKRPLNEIICANTPLFDYARRRMGLMAELLKRGGNNG